MSGFTTEEIKERLNLVGLLHCYAEESTPETCTYLFNISNDYNIPIEVVRNGSRILREFGLLEYHKGLMNDEGECRGSGYCISEDGVNFLNYMEQTK